MKFYTHKWFLSDRELDDSTESAARIYFKEIQQKLPPSIRAFSEAINLHDAHLLHLAYSTERSSLTITLDELFWNPTRNCGSRRVLNVHYELVTGFSLRPPSPALVLITQQDDLLCDEMDIVAEGIFEHRMVFASGIELHIDFGAFSHFHAAK